MPAQGLRAWDNQYMTGNKMLHDDIEIPATEIQIAELMSVLAPAGAIILRKMAFERDKLKQDVERLNKELEWIEGTDGDEEIIERIREEYPEFG